ncbi:MAG: CHRD domain-containing protein [Gemmatimonadota bacterium]
MRLQTSAFGLLAIAMLVACDTGTDADLNEQFSATLTGAAEVPPKTTTASGGAEFVHDISAAELEFVLTVDDIENVRAAHIHLAQPGANGPVIAFLFSSDNPVTVSTPTVLSTGFIRDADVLTVEGFDGTFASLMAQIRAGNTYVNVHTTQNPGGEVRGQIGAAP